MSKHTQGPWVASISSSWGSHWVNASKHDARGVCRLDDRTSAFPPDDDEAIANARLIAAAPDLLDALQDMLCGDYHDCPAVRARRANARAAIAKATGEQQ